MGDILSIELSCLTPLIILMPLFPMLPLLGITHPSVSLGYSYLFLFWVHYLYICFTISKSSFMFSS